MTFVYYFSFLWLYFQDKALIIVNIIFLWSNEWMNLWKDEGLYFILIFSFVLSFISYSELYSCPASFFSSSRFHTRKFLLLEMYFLCHTIPHQNTSFAIVSTQLQRHSSSSSSLFLFLLSVCSYKRLQNCDEMFKL